MTTVCRLCLGLPTETHSLLETLNSYMLETLTSIRIDPNDSSTIACTKCLDEMKMAFTIQQNFLKANLRFEEESVEVKSEPLEILLPESFIKCEICTTFVEGNAMLQHTKNHFEKPQSCDLCQQNFNNMTLYKKHWNELHKDHDDYKCLDCNVKFRYKCIYLVHRNEAHGGVGQTRDLPPAVSSNEETMEGSLVVPKYKPHICTICAKSFVTKTQVKAHELTHVKKACPVCNSAVTVANYQIHLDNHKTGPQICEVCGSILSSTQSLKGHMKIVHGNFRKVCEECGKLFTHRYRFLVHMKKHKGDKSHVCDVCSKSFYTFYDMNKHKNTVHLNIKPHICPYCQKPFAKASALTTHLRQHTRETPYRCEMCGEGFRQKVSLRTHRVSKHNIEEPKTCECTICGKKFASETAVTVHMRHHERC